MKILFVCPTDPRETAYGGQQRTHVIWKGLQSVGDVWTVVPVPHKRMEKRDEQNRIYKLCLERRYSVGWFVQRIIFRLFPQLAVPFGLVCSALSEVILNPDICVVHTLWIAARFGAWRIAPMFVDVDDTPTVDFGLANPNRWFRRWLLQKWQNLICAKAKGLWVPDPEQIEGLRPFKASYLPNIPLGDIAPVDRTKVDQNRLLFLGYLAHRPNIVALDWFLKSFWSDLKKVFPGLKLDVVGGGLPDEYKAKWSAYHDVKLHGFVQDTLPFFERSLALVTPMQIGSGTCIKVLESLAKGVPVVSTNQGLRGVAVCDRTDRNGIFLFDKFLELTAVIRILSSQSQDQEVREFPIALKFTQKTVNEIMQKELLAKNE